MIRILIEDKLGVVVEALVNVKKRRVESLVVETERGMNEAFIAEALLAIEMEIEMGRRVNGLKPKLLTGRLTREQMARAMGLVPCKSEWDHECSTCEDSTIDWMKGSGQVLEGFCNACLPAAYDAHVIEQVGEDLETGRQGDLEKRAADLECEGGVR